MATLALACYALYLALAFGLRTLVQLPRMGSVPASAEAVEPLDALDTRVAHIVGTILFAAGLGATLAAQLAMGSCGGSASIPTSAPSW
jgi:hypothetical protein